MVKKRDDGLYDIPEANLYGIPENAVPPNLRMAAVTPEDLYQPVPTMPDMRLADNGAGGAPSNNPAITPSPTGSLIGDVAQGVAQKVAPILAPSPTEMAINQAKGGVSPEAFKASAAAANTPAPTIPAGAANPTGLHFGPTSTEPPVAPSISDPYQRYADLNKMQGTGATSVPRKNDVFAGGVTTQEGPAPIPGEAPVAAHEKEPLPQAYTAPNEVYGADEIRRRIAANKEVPQPTTAFDKDVEEAAKSQELSKNMAVPEVREATAEEPYTYINNPKFNPKKEISPENSPKIAVPKTVTPYEQAKEGVKEAQLNQFSNERDIATRKAEEQGNIGDVYMQAAQREKQMMDQAIEDRQALMDAKQKEFEDITAEYLRRTQAINPADMHPSFATALGQGLVYFGSLKAGHPIPAINWMNDEVNRNIEQQQRAADAYGKVAGLKLNELGRLQQTGMDPLAAQNVIAAQMWQQASHQAKAMSEKYAGSEFGDNLNKAGDLMEQEAAKKELGAHEANKKSQWQDIPAHVIAGKAPQTPEQIAEDEVKRSGVKFKTYDEFKSAVDARRTELVQEGNAAALQHEAMRRFPGKGPDIDKKRQEFLDKAYETAGIKNKGVPQISQEPPTGTAGPDKADAVFTPDSEIWPEYQGKPLAYNNQQRSGLASLEKYKVIQARGVQLRHDFDELAKLHRQYGASWATNREAAGKIQTLSGSIENNMLALSQEGTSDIKLKSMAERTATDWANKIVTFADPEAQIEFAKKIATDLVRSVVPVKDNFHPTGKTVRGTNEINIGTEPGE